MMLARIARYLLRDMIAENPELFDGAMAAASVAVCLAEYEAENGR